MRWQPILGRTPFWPAEIFGVGTGTVRVESPPTLSGAGARGILRLRIRDRSGSGRYVIVLGAAAVVVPVVCDSGGSIAAGILAVGIVAGALILGALVIWNVLALVRSRAARI
ncbi:MAG: hypothetical protein KA191_03320 [Verrucomicrobia bacterium]|nr:hypothetical protein [Verrucomicrobiota bacterium]HOA60519.1 hypothetical protein [Verrucomicrobiota bacterium]HPW79640.1 hypothetical protein [Verrucomicrobiota bacterium]HQA40096.1 hypothetical protein [Verrucomicrobiota bacterium]